MKQFFIFIVFLLVYINTLFANISLDKTYVLFENNTRNADIRVFNRGAETKQYTISFVHYKQDQNGKYTDLDKETSILKFADNLLIYTPRTFTIEPGKTQLIRIQRKSLADIDDGEYFAHMLIKEVPDTKKTEEEEKVSMMKLQKGQLGIDIKPLFGMSFPIIVRKGNLEVESKILSAKRLEKDGKYFLSVSISRVGNKSIRGDLMVKYKNEVIGDTKGLNIFLGNEKRVVDVPFIADRWEQIQKENQGKPIKLTVVYQDVTTTNNIIDQMSLDY
jgi:hypothetical protein